MKDRIIQIPKLEKRITNKDRVMDLLKTKDYTSNELARKLNIDDRIIRDIIMKLKYDIPMIETKCRCGHTPIYMVKK